MSPSNHLYLKGNAAKSKIMGMILDEIADGRKTVVFDYGCGDAGYWPDVLENHKNIYLYYFDINKESMDNAEKLLEMYEDRAERVSKPLKVPAFAADYVISFSVLEHVFDRKRYLRTAFQHLKPGGLCFLNYDDGHFRNSIRLYRPFSYLSLIKEIMINTIGRISAVVGNQSFYQHRVKLGEADKLAKGVGFAIEGIFFSNLPSLKGFFNEIEEEEKGGSSKKAWSEKDRRRYAEKWRGIEDLINDLMLGDEPEPDMDIQARLWPHALSRTLVLRKPKG